MVKRKTGRQLDIEIDAALASSSKGNAGASSPHGMFVGEDCARKFLDVKLKKDADWITVYNALSSRYRDAADALGYRGPLIRTLSEALPVFINQDVSPDVPGVAHEPFLSDARLAELLDGGYETQDEVHAMAMELSMQRKRNLPGGSQ